MEVEMRLDALTVHGVLDDAGRAVQFGLGGRHQRKAAVGGALGQGRIAAFLFQVD